jgi:hypothetical protein
LEVADIFLAHGEEYRRQHPLTRDQGDAMRAIEACRTAVLGGHVDVCQQCGFARPAYNSCRNRHCPKCQALSAAKWVAERMDRVLPTHYFHSVFTLPAHLRPLCRRQPKPLFDLLFASASQTLLELGRDPQRLGAQLGFTLVLHTWTRALQYHPHVHVIVTGGGLAPQGDRWIAARPDYLFPVQVQSALFRGKFLDGLRQLYGAGALDLGGQCSEVASPRAFQELLDRLYQLDWVVYAKRPFAGPEQVFRYLGHYTHRVGLSNRRLVSFDERGVCFRTKDGKTVTLTPQEFIRRFLLHVLPTGFVKIRHYGLMAASNAKTKLAVARKLLTPARPITQPPAGETTAAPSAPLVTPQAQAAVASAATGAVLLSGGTGTGAAAAMPQSTAVSPTANDWREVLKQLTGLDLSQCPSCGHGMMRRHALPTPPWVKSRRPVAPPRYEATGPPDTS